MNSEFQKVGLYDHNIASYKKIKEALSTSDVASIVHATGTGKTYNALQLAYDNPDKKIVYVVPNNSIIEHIEKIIEDNPNLDRNRDFPNLEFRLYQSFINMSSEEIEAMDLDLLIVDELHHIGAPVWGARINSIVETHPDIKILGMTAYTVRDRGTAYERDMVNEDTEELFSGSVVSRYDLVDALIDGVLAKPIYRSAHINLDDDLEEIEELIEEYDSESEETKELLEAAKKRVHEAEGIKELIKKYIKPNGKYIYFCPPGAGEGTNDIDTIIEEAKEWFYNMGLTDENIVIYKTTSKMGEEGKKNREAFYNDEDLDEKNAGGKLRIIFAINQYNEGVHAPNIDGVIMGRGTKSDIVFFEQLGRALSVRGDTKGKFEEYERYSVEELKRSCQEKGIQFKEDEEKEELIEKLLSPIVIDLVDNFEFMLELEDNLKNRVKEIQKKGLGIKRDVKIKDVSFDINVLNRDIFELLNRLRERLKLTWDKMYKYAKIYYEYHGNLEVPKSFKTNNGYEYNEKGAIKLGLWVYGQRQNTSSKSEHGKLLSQIGICFDNIYDLKWQRMYEYAKIYYEHHSNLEVAYNFKTSNGYEYDENGKIRLGIWISTQRTNAAPESERGKLLLQIGMRFKNKISTLSWEDMYEYAKAYYEHHGNLEVPVRFKTNNGYIRDKNGLINLGKWVKWQREKTFPKSERGKLLSQIGMRFDIQDRSLIWPKTYEYAKLYYEHNGHLDIPIGFKTNNGYEYDENGKINLRAWIQTQRAKTAPESERGKLLSQIGMIWSVKVNKEEVGLMCIENGIDVEINKTIISHISIQELQAKIMFLQEYYIPLIGENGILHEIFSMSSLNMKAKYGLTLEDLISKYSFELIGKGIK